MESSSVSALSMTAAARALPRVAQMITSVSKTIEASLAKGAHMGHRIGHLVTVRPHAENVEVLDAGAFCLTDGFDSRYRFTTVGEGDRLVARNGIQNLPGVAPHVQNGCFHDRAFI